MATPTEQEFQHFDALYEAALEAFPNCQVETDNMGQFIIYTNLMERPDGRIVAFEDIP